MQALQRRLLRIGCVAPRPMGETKVMSDHAAPGITDYRPAARGKAPTQVIRSIGRRSLVDLYLGRRTRRRSGLSLDFRPLATRSLPSRLDPYTLFLRHALRKRGGDDGMMHIGLGWWR